MAEKNRKIAKSCLRCGAPFTARPGNSAYCSRSCAMLTHFDQVGRKGTKNYRGACEVCGKEYQRKYFYKGGRTCGLKCAAILRIREGKGRPFYPKARLVVQKGNYLREYAPKHPKADKDGRVAQHRLIMERHLGRQLEDWEKVHHRNGVKTDNRIDNLEIVTHARPNGWVICPHCRKAFQVH